MKILERDRLILRTFEKGDLDTMAAIAVLDYAFNVLNLAEVVSFWII